MRCGRAAAARARPAWPASSTHEPDDDPLRLPGRVVLILGPPTRKPMLRRLVRSWGVRVAVEGDSMRPTLRPGDWLLIDPDAYADAPPKVGDLVLVPDPREPVRLLVKRVAEVHDEGRELFVAGDAPDASTDSRAFGSVRTSTVEGRPWFRCWPLRRIGRAR